jgi:hypothetical protein
LNVKEVVVHNSLLLKMILFIYLFIYPIMPSHLHGLHGARLGDDESQRVCNVVIIACLKAVPGYAYGGRGKLQKT